MFSARARTRGWGGKLAITGTTLMSKLICLAGNNKEDEFLLSEGTTIMGRAAECTIVLFDKKCSREHCQVFKKGNYYAIEDLESRHGTKLNGKPIKKRQSLKMGDKIHLGQTTLVLSDRAVGNLITQTASDAAADLTGKDFGKLMASAEADVAIRMRDSDAKRAGLKGLFGSLFKRK